MARIARGPPEVFCYFTIFYGAWQPFFAAICFVFGFFAPHSALLCRKRVLNVVYALFEHLQNVEAHGNVVSSSPHKKVTGDIEISLLLFMPHRLRWGAEAVGKAGLYLSENDRIPVFCHDVRLPEGRFIVGFQNFIAELFQEFCAPLFPCPAQNFFVNVLR